MKKTYRLADLDCANCAAKMENRISSIKGVSEVSISFMSQKMIIDADEQGFDEIMEKVEKTIKKIEPDCRIVR